jgi:hypothetical protein
MLATPLGTAVGGPIVAATGAAHTLFISAVATLAIVPFAVMTKLIRNEEARAAQRS